MNKLKNLHFCLLRFENVKWLIMCLIEMSSQIISFNIKVIWKGIPTNLKTVCLLLSKQVQVKNKMTRMIHRGARAVYSHGRRRRRRHPPQSRCQPGESWRRKPSQVSQVWGKEGWGLLDWVPHCVGILYEIKRTQTVHSLLTVSHICLIQYNTNCSSLNSDQTDRVTSTYAQGARPKETAYSPSFSSSYASTARESSLNRHLSSSTSHRSPPLARDFSTRTASRFLNGSSSLHSSQEQSRNPESSSNISSSYSSRTPWSTTPQAVSESMLPTRLIPEGGEPEGRRSTRHFLSRLFSRRSSQDSSSGSSSVRSLDDDSPSTGGESVDSDECARMPSVEPGTGGSEATLGSLRNRRADLAPIRENNNDGYRSGPAQSRPSLWREPGVGTTNNTSTAGGSSSSWLSSSLRGRCPPLLSRLRRHVRDESAHSAASLEEGYSRPQHLLRRWDNLERTASQDEDDDEEGEEDDEEKEEGAVGAEAFGAGHPCRLEDEALPELEDTLVGFSPRRRVGGYENISVSRGPLSGVESQLDEQKEKPVSSRDQEKLREIKER